MPIYRVLTPVKSGGKRHMPGASLDLSEQAGKLLARIGAVLDPTGQGTPAGNPIPTGGPTGNPPPPPPPPRPLPAMPLSQQSAAKSSANSSAQNINKPEAKIKPKAK